MRQNPLIAPILHILNQSETGYSEYELIRQLELDQDVFDVADTGYSLQLYKKHFMVMNALYGLQGELLAEGVYLEISALHIAINPDARDTTGNHLPDLADVKLREYYLDWNNYDATGEQEVQRLLAGFWQRYTALDKQQQALQILELDGAADWVSVNEGYRRMAKRHHPDKGGDAKKFIEVREAYEILRSCYERK